MVIIERNAEEQTRLFRATNQQQLTSGYRAPSTSWLPILRLCQVPHKGGTPFTSPFLRDGIPAGASKRISSTRDSSNENESARHDVFLLLLFFH